MATNPSFSGATSRDSETPNLAQARDAGTGAGNSAINDPVQRQWNEYFSCTVAITGTGTGAITPNDLNLAAGVQHPVLGTAGTTRVAMIRSVDVYTQAGNFISLSVREFPNSVFFSKVQYYDIGIEGSSRGNLKYHWPGHIVAQHQVATDSVEPFCQIQALNLPGLTDASWVAYVVVSFNANTTVSVPPSIALMDLNMLRKPKAEQEELYMTLRSRAVKKQQIKEIKDLTMPVADAQ